MISLSDGQTSPYRGAPGRIIRISTPALTLTPGRPRFFGLLGREEDYVLPWKNIVRVGSDIILVEVKGDFLRRKRQNRWG